MTPIDIQVSRPNGNVKGQAYSSHVWKGGISVLQTSIFYARLSALFSPFDLYNLTNSVMKA